MSQTKTRKPQEFYDEVKQKFAQERDLRLNFRPEGTQQFNSELTGNLARYEVDTYAEPAKPREPLNDFVECLFIGGGFSALLTSYLPGASTFNCMTLPSSTSIEKLAS